MTTTTLTAKEIYRRLNGGEPIDSDSYSDAWDEGQFRAMNATWNAGINPEGVEKMKEYCELQERWEEERQFEYGGTIYYNNSYGENHFAKALFTRLRKEALTAAKL